MVCWMTEQPSSRPGAKYCDQAHDPHRPGRWSRTCSTGSTSTRCTATTTADGARPQRDRPGQPAHHAAALLRRVPPQPRRPAASSSSTRRTNNTVAAGMILGPSQCTLDRDARPSRSSPNVVWHAGPTADAAERWDADRPSGATVWFTGLSGSGKSTVAVAVERLLLDRGPAAYLLDGDNLRHGLNGDLGFTADDRDENVRRVVRGRPAVRRRRRGRPRAAHQPVPRRPRAAPAASTTAAGLPFVEVFVDTPDRGVRAARPQGPLRQGPGRRDHGLHRHRRPLRGARRARAGASPRRRRTAEQALGAGDVARPRR